MSRSKDQGSTKRDRLSMFRPGYREPCRCGGTAYVLDDDGDANCMSCGRPVKTETPIARRQQA